MDNNGLIERARTTLDWRQLSEECTASDVAAALVTERENVYCGVSLSAACGIGYCGETAAIAAMLTAGETRIAKSLLSAATGK
jgi:cytidine deaminase